MDRLTPADTSGDPGAGTTGNEVTPAGTGRPEAGAPGAGSDRRGRPLRTRLRGLLVVSGALLVAMSITCALLFADLVQARGTLVERIDPASLAADRMLLGLVDQETGVRGYVLSGDRDFLAPWNDGLRDERTAHAMLRRTLAGQGHLLVLLSAAERAATTWQTRIAAPAIARVGPDKLPQPASRDALLQGKNEFDVVRRSFDALSGGLARARAAEAHTLDAATVALLSALLVTLAATVLTALVLVLGLRRWVTEPLAAIGADVQLVAAGDIAHPVAPVGPPEIRAVAVDVEAMRNRIGAELVAVEEARAELSARNVELARSNQDLEQFAYVASHDLQEPLRKVTSFVQLLQQRYGGQLDERADSYIGFAVDGAKRMQVLIQDLLAFSRVGRTSTHIGPVDLEAVLDAALRGLAAAIEDAGGIVRVGALPTVEGNPGLLTALWQNLIGNSLKFRSDDTPVVVVDAVRRDASWELSVTDNGIGIDARFADKIFVIFQRLHSREAYEGTGIGLALCRRIVEFHGGEIGLDPDHRPGARIWFTLPARVEDPDAVDGSGPGPGSDQPPPDPDGSAGDQRLRGHEPQEGRRG